MTALRLSPPATKRGVMGWDLENRPMAYWYDGATTSQITAIGWKKDDDDVQAMLLLPSGRFDTGGLRSQPAVKAYSDFRSLLIGAGLTYGHNVRRHDFPIFNAALLRCGLPPLPEMLTTDTLRDYPRTKDMSASLENLCELYGVTVPGADGKKHMGVVTWERANQLLPEGIAEAKERVVTDVLLQEALWRYLLERELLVMPRKWSPRR